MLVNLWHGEGASAADRRLTVTVRLDPAVRRVGRLSRTTGLGEMLPIDNGAVKVTLPGGTGDLLRIGGVAFPGVSTGGACP